MSSIERRADHLFLEVVDLPVPEREVALGHVEANEPELAIRVRALLATDEDNVDGLLDRSLHRSLDGGGPSEIGGYRIMSTLGEGGMGVVYRAEQRQPRRAVAVKVIRPGLASAESLRRLELEAELLGRMQHVGIAQVYEAGIGEAVYPNGSVERRFIAMELIDGLNIVEYCRSEELSPSQIMELVAKVADAVHHAHCTGTVHRDLKPANILVPQSGEPKVLDFGAARIMDSGREGITEWTGAGQIIGTLQYMSPEQGAGGGATVDGRSDVYSLGVVLYQLLTGKTPFGGSGESLAAILRQLEFATPSRIDRMDPRFKGDIATVVHHALERDPVDRYVSADALARDLRHASRHEPIESIPPSRLYRARKFVRRHRRLVIATTSAFAVLLCCLVAVVALASRLERQRVQSERAGYLNVLRSSSSAILRGNPGQVKGWLRAVDEELRGWEWRHLQSRIPEAVEVKRFVKVTERGAPPVLSSVRSGLRIDPRGGQAHLAVEIAGEGLRTITWSLDDWDHMEERRFGIRIEGSGAYESLVAGAMFGPPRTILPCPSGEDEFRVVGPSGESPRLSILDDPTFEFFTLKGDTAGSGPGPGITIALGHDMSFARLPRSEGQGSYGRPIAGWLVLPPDSVHLAAEGSQQSSIAVICDSLRRLDLYDLESGELATSYSSNVDWSDWQLSKDGARLIAVTGHGDIHGWEIGTGRPLPWSPLKDSDGGIKCVSVLGDGTRFVTGGARGVVRERDLETGAILATHRHPDALILGVAYEPKSEAIIAVDDHGLICRWAPQPSEPWALQGHTSYVYPSAVSPDGSLIASGSWDETIRVWDSKTGAAVATYANAFAGGADSSGVARGLAFLAGGRRLAVTSGGFGTVSHEFYVIDLLTGAVELPMGLGPNSAIASDASGRRLAMVDGLGELIVRDAATWEVLARAPAAAGVCGVSPGEDPLVAVQVADPPTGTVNLLRLRDLSFVCQIEAGDRLISSCAFSPGADRIALSTNHGTLVFDTRSGDRIALLEAEEPIVHDVAFSPDGTRIATGSHDGVVNIWDAELFDLRAQLLGHGVYVYSLSWTSDPSMIVSGSGDGTVRIWDHRNSSSWFEAQIERLRALERVGPVVFERLRATGNAAEVAASFLGEGQWSPREREVAAQIVMGESMGEERPAEGAR